MLRPVLDPERIPRANFPTRFGNFEILGFESELDGEQAVALLKGDLNESEAPLVRIHSQCFTGDTLHSLRCDCGDQLEHALERISREAPGVLIYQMQEGRGIGLVNKLRAYELQDQGIDTVDANLRLGFDADERNYQSGRARPIGCAIIFALQRVPQDEERENGTSLVSVLPVRTVP